MQVAHGSGPGGGGHEARAHGQSCLSADYHSLKGRTHFISSEYTSKKWRPHPYSVQAHCPCYITHMLICTLKKLQPSTSIEKLLASTFMAPATSMHRAILPFHSLVCTSFCNVLLHSSRTPFCCRRCSLKCLEQQ